MSDEQKIVPAVLSAVGPAPGSHIRVSQLVELAMANAVKQAISDGVSVYDAEKIIAYKMNARAAVLAQMSR